MRRSLLTICLFLVLVMPAFPCGAPQAIYGRAVVGIGGLSWPLYGVKLSNGFEAVRTNPFGYYRFSPILPCETVTIVAGSKSTAFDSVTILPIDFPADGSGVEVNFVRMY